MADPASLPSEQRPGQAVDPVTGVAVYNSYSDDGWVVYGGTSASSPLVAVKAS